MKFMKVSAYKNVLCIVKDFDLEDILAELFHNFL
jgi:hypothetical protein